MAAQEPPATNVPAAGGTPPPFSGRLKLHGEFRVRYEDRVAQTFGLDPDRAYPLVRSRAGLNYKAAESVRLSITIQDVRAPFYGGNAPATSRDWLDLYEAIVELYPDRSQGFSATFGRQPVEMGDGRLIGVPDWVNFGRVYDGGRISYRTGRAKFEVLLISVVKPRSENFNYPVFGDRLWGTYNSFAGVIPKTEIEWYILRHDVNRPGGFTEPGRQMVNTFGTRIVRPLGGGVEFTAEGALQSGHWGNRQHRAGGGVFHVSKEIPIRRPMEASVEYKYASGTKDFSSGRHSTFDQLYPAAHNRTGHADLFAWKNIHNIQAQADVQLAAKWLLTVMYDNSWLASATDYAYTAQGQRIVRAPDGTAGRHLGHEFGTYTGYTYGPFKTGGGFAYFLAGEFIRNTTPGVNTRFWYFYQSFRF